VQPQCPSPCRVGKTVAQPADNARPKIVENDPIHAQLYSWELKYLRRRGKEFTRSKGMDRPSE
jgi:hypothetical protein